MRKATPEGRLASRDRGGTSYDPQGSVPVGLRSSLATTVTWSVDMVSDQVAGGWPRHRVHNITSSQLLGRDHPGGVSRHPPLDGSRLFPEHPNVTGIVGWRFGRNSEAEAAQETHLERHHQVAADIRLVRVAVARGSVRRHRGTVARVAEHAALGSRMAGLPVHGDHESGGDAPPQLLVIPNGRVVTVRRARAGVGQVSSERLETSVQQVGKVLEVSFLLRLAGRREREGEPFPQGWLRDPFDVHGQRPAGPLPFHQNAA